MSETETPIFEVAILGFGNPTRNDDGIGCRVAQKLAAFFQPEGKVLVLDMGTSAFEVLFQLKRAKKIIFVDAVVNSGKEAGTIFCVPAAEIKSETDQKPMLFLHSLKWSQALYYAKNIMGENYPSDDAITVYLIAVDDVNFGETIAPEVLAAGDRLTEDLQKEHG